MKQIGTLFQLPGEYREEFFRISADRNARIIQIVCLLTALTELFNLHRVLATNIKLGTLNNRIYFAFYLFLFLASLLFLGLTRAASGKFLYQNGLHFCGAMVIVLWNALLNAYDILSSHNDNVTVITTAFLGFSVLVQTTPLRALAVLLLPYLLFLLLTLGTASPGCLINLTVSVVVSLIVSFAHFRFVLQNMRQRRSISAINEELTAEREKLRVSLEQHRIIMEQSSDIMMHWDIQGDQMTFSRNWTRLSGYPLVVAPFSEWLWKSQDEGVARELTGRFEAYRTGKTAGECQIPLRTAGGENRWYQLRMVIQEDHGGRAVEGIGILRDISSQKHEIAQLQSQLQSDTLTGILNKQGVEGYTTRQLQKMGPEDCLTILMLDLDDFKRVNDTFGHPCGDHVLREMAHSMRHVFRKRDGLGRIGGDEFMAVLPGLCCEEAVRRKAGQLLESVRQITWNGGPVGVSSSIGGIVICGPDYTFEELYYMADEALYRAKSTGKDHLCLILPQEIPEHV